MVSSFSLCSGDLKLVDLWFKKETRENLGLWGGLGDLGKIPEDLQRQGVLADPENPENPENGKYDLKYPENPEKKPIF